MLESLVIAGGDESDIDRALAALVSYEDVPEWQWRSTVDALTDRVQPALKDIISGDDLAAAEKAKTVLHNIERVKDALEQRIADPAFRLETSGHTDAQADALGDLVKNKSFSYRGMSTWDTQVVQGNMRFGGPIADHMVTRQDRVQFEGLLDKPVDELIAAMGGDMTALPDSAHGKTLNEIADVNVFLDAAQKLIRTNFSTVERELEVIDGETHHRLFDEPMEGFNRLAGAPSEAEARMAFDSRTSISAEFAKGLGDCRHHAQALQILFDGWQRGHMDKALLNAHSAENPDERQTALQRFDKLMRTELRTFDVEVFAPIEMKEIYRPARANAAVGDCAAEKSFVAASEVAHIESHTLNMLVRSDHDGAITSVRFADAFYQNVYEWGDGEIDLAALDTVDGDLALPAGKLKSVQGAEDNTVDVLIKPTVYAGNRRALAPGDAGVIWERGTPYTEFDLVSIIEERETVNENIARATAALCKPHVNEQSPSTASL